MKTRSLCLAIVSIVAVIGVVGAAEPPPAGIDVSVEPWLSDLNTVVVTVDWTSEADEAFISLTGPEGIEAILQGGTYVVSGGRQSVGSVSAGQKTTVEIFGLDDGQHAFLAAERAIGTESFQLVSAIEVNDRRPIVNDSQPYRVFQKEIEGSGQIGRVGAVGQPMAMGNPTERTVVVESLQSKTAAVWLGEDPANADLLISAPGDCVPATHVWRMIRQISFNAAPPGSVTTNIAVHVMMTHADASQVQIGYTEDDHYFDPIHLYYGVYLWFDEPFQVNLDRTWTRDKYNQELPGIGRDPNGWFQLWLVDCTGGAVGTLDYWSVEVTYDTPANYDLVADSLSVTPATAAPGDDVEVIWDGHVGGTDPIVGGFSSRIYLSSDTNINTSDTVLDTVTEGTASNPGDSFGDPSPGRTVTLPGGLSDGTWYVGVIVDFNGAVAENDENNNIAWDAISIDSSPSVDLVADTITPQSGSVEAGSTIAVNWFAHSDGGSSGDVTDVFSVGFYLSQDASITAADTLLDRATVTGPISPGESFGGNGRSLSIPGGVAAGNWYLGIIVDDTGVVAETSEANNVASAAVTVTGGGSGQADLVATGCTLGATEGRVGDVVSISWQGRNDGGTDAPAFLAGAYLSEDAVYNPATDLQLRSRSLGPWPAGHTESVTWNFTIRSGTAAGVWQILVAADTGNTVPESDENNNFCSATLTVIEDPSTTQSLRWLVPAAASATGFGGSDWRTQMAITNSTDQQRQASVYYVSDSSSWPGVLLTGPINIGARRSHYLDDLLFTLRPTSGLLYVVFDAPGPVVTSRTYNRAADGSTFGQGIPGIPLDGGEAAEELILPMVHSGADRFHTNLGLVQASAGSMTVEVSIYSAGGSLLANQQRTVTDGWDQINDVFDKMGIGIAAIEGGWISVRLVSGSPDAWTCYASVVDKDTGDPTYVGGVEAE